MTVALSSSPPALWRGGLPLGQRVAVRRSIFGGGWLVLISLLFNDGLCLVDTSGHLVVTNTVVATSELLILACALWCVRRAIGVEFVVLSLLVVGYVMAAKVINPQESPKILHDLLIPYAFFMLGRVAGVASARRVFSLSAMIVLGFGFFELFFVDLFGRIFNVWQYYIHKGALAENTINYANTTLFVSGNRGGSGRTYLPSLLGSHRISSVFLEPVSMGNFAAIVFAWCLSVWRTERAMIVWGGLLCAAICIVLSDSRFATGCCLMMLIMRLIPLCRSSLFVFLLPLVIMALLTITGSFYELPGIHPSILVDDFKGRLLFSGRLLDDWPLGAWFAVAPSPVYTADTGYAYLFNTIGAPLAVCLFAVFSFSLCVREEASIMRLMLAVYFSTSLCIGANSATIKTAALAWFLYGALNADRKSYDQGRTEARSLPVDLRKPVRVI